jgi:hypothetical protein
VPTNRVRTMPVHPATNMTERKNIGQNHFDTEHKPESRAEPAETTATVELHMASYASWHQARLRSAKADAGALGRPRRRTMVCHPGQVGCGTGCHGWSRRWAPAVAAPYRLTMSVVRARTAASRAGSAQVIPVDSGHQRCGVPGPCSDATQAMSLVVQLPVRFWLKVTRTSKPSRVASTGVGNR